MRLLPLILIIGLVTGCVALLTGEIQPAITIPTTIMAVQIMEVL